MKPRCYLIMLLSILVVSCSSHPSEEPTSTLLAPTQFAVPIVTTGTSPASTSAPSPPFLTPWSKLVPEPLIFIPGDLPSTYEISVVDHTYPKGSLLYEYSFPVPTVKTSLEILDSSNSETSYVVIMLYESLSQRDAAMNKLLGNHLLYDASASIDLDDIGEEALFLPLYSAGIESVLFTRCYALVYMEIRGKALDYAQKLDERLSPFVCPSVTNTEAGPF